MASGRATDTWSLFFAQMIQESFSKITILKSHHFEITMLKLLSWNHYVEIAILKSLCWITIMKYSIWRTFLAPYCIFVATFFLSKMIYSIERFNCYRYCIFDCGLGVKSKKSHILKKKIQYIRAFILWVLQFEEWDPSWDCFIAVCETIFSVDTVAYLGVIISWSKNAVYVGY